jgi:hypothetical protein
VMQGTAKRNDISSNAVAMTLILTHLYLTISTNWIYGDGFKYKSTALFLIV